MNIAPLPQLHKEYILDRVAINMRLLLRIRMQYTRICVFNFVLSSYLFNNILLRVKRVDSL